MAKRRQVSHPYVDRFADGRVETWLTNEDRVAVATASASVEALAAVTGGLHASMRLSGIPAEGRDAWALASLAAGHRCRAITAWAAANSIPSSQALDYFLGEPQVVTT
ncbi:hypothetical protein GCM10022399_20000 [Terrabacter ginsenosidimutans]|uniref:Uncharacterized protein n=1 Tax=Terrabacter ginsenosidimutans TaxID=490575 RepID=A0ABP7DER5_9MICO